jgi:hypothetical protein
MAGYAEPVPYADIDTIFLDVGNTLISIDFDRIAEVLAARQLPCEADGLRRAEAAARPGYSERLFVTGVSPHRSVFHWYRADRAPPGPGKRALAEGDARRAQGA